MHIATAISALAAAFLLISCGPQEASPEIDPMLGRACFEYKLPSLPPGSQYEGIEGTDGKRLAIKVMDGVGVSTVYCGLAADGTLEN